MAFGLSAGAIAAIGTTAVGAYSASQNASAASADQNTNAVLGLYGGMINQQNLINTQNLVAPFIDAGLAASREQRSLLGLNGNGAQGASIDALRASPQFQSMLAEGENSLLQNASATGGLRGGNTQAALARFSPSLLAATINDRLGQLGGLATVAGNTALGQGSLASQAGATQAGIIQNMQAQNSAATRAGMQANNQMANSVAGGLGMWAGLGGGSGGGAPPSGYGSWGSYNYGNTGSAGSDGLSGFVNLNDGWGTL
jgi:hypothetical protein